MQNTIQKFRQSSIVFEKPDILPENLKFLTSCNYPAVQYFFLKCCTSFLLTNVYKRVCGIFLFCLDLELFAKILSCLQKSIKTCFLHICFCTFINNSRSKQNKKNSTQPFVDITK